MTRKFLNKIKKSIFISVSFNLDQMVETMSLILILNPEFEPISVTEKITFLNRDVRKNGDSHGTKTISNDIQK